LGQTNSNMSKPTMIYVLSVEYK